MNPTHWIVALGRPVVAQVASTGRAGLFLLRGLLCCVTPPVKLERVVRQLWFIGWKSMGVILLTGAFTGAVLAFQGYNAFSKVGSQGFLGPLVALSLIRELGPVLAALMVTGRAGSAIAAEIGMMRNNEQIDALALMGLNPMRYLVAPNLIAFVIALPLLVAVFDFVGIWGGWLAGVQMLGLSDGTYFGSMRNYVEWGDLLDGLWKSMAFGLLIGAVCCGRGYHSRFGSEGVSAATTQAVVNSSVLIFVCDCIITLLT